MDSHHLKLSFEVHKMNSNIVLNIVKHKTIGTITSPSDS